MKILPQGRMPRNLLYCLFGKKLRQPYREIFIGQTVGPPAFVCHLVGSFSSRKKMHMCVHEWTCTRTLSYGVCWHIVSEVIVKMLA